MGPLLMMPQLKLFGKKERRSLNIHRSVKIHVVHQCSESNMAELSNGDGKLITSNQYQRAEQTTSPTCNRFNGRITDTRLIIGRSGHARLKDDDFRLSEKDYFGLYNVVNNLILPDFAILNVTTSAENRG